MFYPASADNNNIIIIIIAEGKTCSCVNLFLTGWEATFKL